MINGWLNINKPRGMSSCRVTNIIKKSLNVKKIGHAGTLDVLADGVLPIAIGEATKLIRFLTDAKKEYNFDINFGAQTSSYDCEGEITAKTDYIPNEQQILNILNNFIGEIEQTPPIFSAIKINGKRAYKLAREGKEDIKIKSRKITIYDLKLNYMKDNIANLTVKCSKGTYIRSLANDIAIFLNSLGHVSKLTRTKVGKFLINNTILLENTKETVYKDKFLDFLLPIEVVLDDIPVHTFNSKNAMAIKHGRQVSCKLDFDYIEDMAIFSNDQILALAKYEDGLIKPHKVFNL